MRTVVECLVIVAMVELLYFNLTSIPKKANKMLIGFNYGGVQNDTIT